MLKQQWMAGIAGGFLGIAVATQAFSCSRVLINDVAHDSVMVGRSMDWEEDMHTNLLVLPRQMPHDGGERENDPNGNWVRWSSKYGSVVATGYENFITDGLNEAGFAAHLLWLEDADYGSRDSKRPGLSLTLWLLYYLDNFKTVEEAVRFSKASSIQVTPYFHEATQQWGKMHLVLDDATGDSAILEYVKGTLQIYHGPQYRVATNEPTYDEHLAHLKKYKGFGGTRNLPGRFDAKSRFVRANFYAKVLPDYTRASQRLVEVLAILNNVAYPYTRIDETQSIWRIVSDLRKRVYYFQASKTQNLLWIDMKRLDFKTPIVRILDMVHHPELVGDVTGKLEVFEGDAFHI